MPKNSPPPGQTPVSFTLNGRPVTTEVDPGETLLDILRDRFGITSPKNACQPQGACGCCTVLINGKSSGKLQHAARTDRGA